MQKWFGTGNSLHYPFNKGLKQATACIFLLMLHSAITKK